MPESATFQSESRRQRILIFALLFVTQLIVTIPRLTTAPLKSDASLATYASQQIANGQPAYRDYIIVHPPVPHYLGAAAILIGRALNVSDVLSIRLLCLALSILIPIVIYHLGEEADSGLGPLAAGAAVLNLFMLMAVWGTHVKLVMLLFFSLTLLFIARRAWIAGGMAFGLAVFSWSGAIVLIIVPIVLFAVLWRDSGKDWLRFLAGLLVIIATILVVLWWSGTLGDFLSQYALTLLQYVTNKLTGQGIRDESMGFINILEKGEVSRVDGFVLILGTVGVVAYLQSNRKSLLRRHVVVTLTTTTLVVVGMLLLDYQSPFDLLPAVPATSIGFAWIAERFLLSWVKWWKSEASPLYGIAIILMLCVVRLGGLSEVPDRLGSQIRAAEWLVRDGSMLYPIQSVGDLSLLVLSGQPNALPIIHAGPKTYLAMQNLGWDTATFIDRLRETRPGIIILDNRNEKKSYLSPLSLFVTSNYLYLGSSTEPNLNIYAALDQPLAVRDGMGIVQLLNSNSPYSFSVGQSLSVDALSQINPAEILVLDPFHYVISYTVGETLTLYWWSLEDTPYQGDIAAQWLDENGNPVSEWSISPVIWIPGAASFSNLDLSTAPSPSSRLAICVAFVGSFGDEITCQDNIVNLDLQRDD